MPQRPTPRRIATLTLLALLLLAPTLATAQPAESPEATLGLFARLWDFVSSVWATGSGLDPDGAGTNTANNGDTGSILEPDGRP